MEVLCSSIYEFIHFLYIRLTCWQWSNHPFIHFFKHAVDFSKWCWTVIHYITQAITEHVSKLIDSNTHRVSWTINLVRISIAIWTIDGRFIIAAWRLIWTRWLLTVRCGGSCISIIWCVVFRLSYHRLHIFSVPSTVHETKTCCICLRRHWFIFVCIIYLFCILHPLGNMIASNFIVTSY